MGVDKCLQARFLLPMQERKIARAFINGSPALDWTRAVKDEEELELLRKASQINDEAMGRFKKLVYEGVSEKQIAARLIKLTTLYSSDQNRMR